MLLKFRLIYRWTASRCIVEKVVPQKVTLFVLSANGTDVLIVLANVCIRQGPIATIPFENGDQELFVRTQMLVTMPPVFRVSEVMGLLPFVVVFFFWETL